MLKSLFGSAVLVTAMAVSSAAQSLSDSEWETIRGFLEGNPDILSQVQEMADQLPAPNQVELDAIYIDASAEKMFQDPMSPVLGNPNGTVEFVKFNDFRCGFCRKVTPEIEALIASDPRVRVTIKEFPILGPESTDAARFALSVWTLGGAEAYSAAEVELYQARQRMAEPLFRKIATDIGLDADAVISGMQAPEIEQHLIANRSIAQNLKITGTPAIIIKNVVARGAIPLSSMQAGVAELYPDAE